MKNNLISAGIGALIILLIIFGLKYCNHKPAVDTTVIPKVDTVYIQVPHYIDSSPIFKPLFPTQVGIYPKDPKPQIPIKCKPDTIEVAYYINEGRIDTVYVESEFLTIFPTAPKLIYGKFQADSVRLELLKTDGTIYLESYTTDYSKANYEFFDGQMRVIPLPTKSTGKRKFRFSGESYLYTTYDPFTKSLEARIDYTGNLTPRLGLHGYSALNVGRSTMGRVGGGLRVKLTK